MDSDKISKNEKNKSGSLIRVTEKLQPSIKESIKNKCTNLIYKVGNINLNSLWKKSQHNQQVYLLGKHYLTQKQSKQSFAKIIWFTYRTNFKVSEELSSDTGWGCLLRVGQMVLASALSRFYSQHTSFSEETISNIIYAFLDDEGEQQKYSISSMMKVAAKQFDLKPGQWFNIAQVGYIIEKLQNKKPMKGSNQLKIRVFNQSIIFIEDVFNDFGRKICKCQNQKIICEKWIANAINDVYQQQLLQGYLYAKLAMHHTMVLGIIGGVPKKALYIVGKQGQQLIYLDPHYVQESVNRKSFSRLFPTFFTTDFRRLCQGDLDPSMGFAFYISNLKQLQSLQELILNRNGKNEFLSMMWDSQHRKQSIEFTQSYELSCQVDDSFYCDG